MVVVLVYDFQAQLFCISCALVLADKILFLGEDVGVAIIKHRLDAVLHHPLYDGAGTWGATAMKENFSHTVYRWLCTGYIVFKIPATSGVGTSKEEEMPPHLPQKQDTLP